MPSITSRQINILQNMQDGYHVYVAQAELQEFQDLCLIEPTDRFPGGFLLSAYGRKVLQFYNRIQAGEVKTMQSQCSGCSNPCS